MRNALCSRYDLCLTLAAHFNDEFDCAACRHVGSYWRESSDLYGCWLLLAAIFKPDAYRQLARADSRTCTVIKKANKKPA